MGEIEAACDRVIWIEEGAQGEAPCDVIPDIRRSSPRTRPSNTALGGPHGFVRWAQVADGEGCLNLTMRSITSAARDSLDCPVSMLTC